MTFERVTALVVRTKDGGTSIIGIYTDDERGKATLKNVYENMGRKQPDLPLAKYTFMLNMPNQ